MRNAVVLGNGRSGRAAADLLRHEGWSVVVIDGEDAWPDGVWDLCVTSPGVPPDHPWKKAACASRVPVISELQLGVERYRALGGKMLAVTGSKGKSSVVKLVADALCGVPCGNYGTPICEVALEESLKVRRFERSNPQSSAISTRPSNVGTWAVVEVSSFQMETTELPSDAFEAAAILNLQEDHLDRHGSVQAYHALKLHLLDFAKVKIGVGSTLNHLPSTFDLQLLKGSYFDNPVLLDNGMCAISLMRAAGLNDGAIRDAFVRFSPLPHRMQTVGTFGGVMWIDDSKATSMSALIAGVTMAASRTSQTSTSNPRKVHLIAGGQPKGDDPRMATKCLAEHVRKAYLIGQCAAMMESAWKDVVPCEISGTLDCAVESAVQSAKEGECVLLSPGTASFDQFKSYVQRGERFAELITRRFT